ncbi:MAG: restriction endonuclease subunit S, partial [bacterium]
SIANFCSKVRRRRVCFWTGIESTSMTPSFWDYTCPNLKGRTALTQHGERIKNELKLKENMILVTRSGTIGKVNIVAKHWEDWVASEHVIRIEPASPNIAGYLYVYLRTPQARQLLCRFKYGAVVDEIDDHHVSHLEVPLLRNTLIQSEINNLALQANRLRAQAYTIEQEAIRALNDEVIFKLSSLRQGK